MNTREFLQMKPSEYLRMRKELGLTAKETAKLFNCQHELIYRIERGTHGLKLESKLNLLHFYEDLLHDKTTMGDSKGSGEKI